MSGQVQEEAKKKAEEELTKISGDFVWPEHLEATLKQHKNKLEENLKEQVTKQLDIELNPKNNYDPRVLFNYKQLTERCYAELSFFAEQCKALNQEETPILPEEIINEFNWASNEDIYGFVKEATAEIEKISDSKELTPKQKKDFVYEFALLLAQEKRHKEDKEKLSISDAIDDPREKEILFLKNEWSSKIKSVVHKKFLTSTADEAVQKIQELVTKDYDLRLMSELPKKEDGTPNPQRGKIYFQINSTGIIDYIVLDSIGNLITGNLPHGFLQLRNNTLTQENLDLKKDNILAHILETHAGRIPLKFLAYNLELEAFLRNKARDAIADQEKTKTIPEYLQTESIEDVNCQCKIAQLLEKFETFNNASFEEKQEFVRDLWEKVQKIARLKEKQHQQPTNNASVKQVLENEEKSLKKDIDNILKDVITIIPEEIQKLFKISSKANFTLEGKHSLCLMSSLPDNRMPEPNKIYLEKKHDKLIYVVLSPQNQKEEGELNITINQELTNENLNSLNKKEILKSLLEKGLIQQSIDELLEEINPKVQQTFIGILFNKIGNIIVSTGLYRFIESVFKSIFSFIHTDVSKALSPFKWLVDNSIVYIWSEIKDILTKPKAYIDRLFRGIIILGSTAGIILGAIGVISLIANPFTGLPVLGTISTICVAIALAAIASKTAKWISSKVARTIYKVDNPDRYIPNKNAIKAFGWNLDNVTPTQRQTNIKTLRHSIIAQVSALHKEISKVPDPEGEGKKAVMLLQKKLQLTEKLWDEIQSGVTMHVDQFFQLLQQEQYNRRRKAIDEEKNIHEYKLCLMSDLPSTGPKEGEIYLDEPSNGRIKYTVLKPDGTTVTDGFDISLSQKWQRGLTQEFLDRYKDPLLEEVLNVTVQRQHTRPGINDTIKVLTNLLVEDIVDLKLKKQQEKQKDNRAVSFKWNCELLFNNIREKLDKEVLRKIKGLNIIKKLTKSIGD